MHVHNDNTSAAIPIFCLRLTLAVLDTVQTAATPDALQGPYTLHALGATFDQFRAILARLTIHGMLEREALRYRLTPAGVRMAELLAQAGRKPLPTRPCPPDWQPAYQQSSARAHCSLPDVLFPNGSCGAVSDAYDDGQWRVSQDTRRDTIGGQGDHCFGTRDDAARENWALAHGAWARVLGVQE